MKQSYLRCWTGLLLCACIIMHPGVVAQSHTPKTVTINSNCGGFYEYLPAGYWSDNKKYPVIIYLHGQGQSGDGSTSSLALVLQAGPTQYINAGTFPSSFTVGGQTYSFIIISPQFKNWPVPADIAAVIDYVKTNYRVDTKRMYVTGASMGGGATWEYAGSGTNVANKIAAIVPVCGASTPNETRADIIANTNLPVWATHNQTDPVVPPSNTDGYVNYINNPTPPNPQAKKTIFPENGHDAWTRSYNPAYKENGLNVYEWMLQYERSGVAAPLPVVLSDYKVVRTGSEVTVSWTTTAEWKNSHFSIERSQDGVQFTVIGQVAGENKATGSTYSYIDKQPLTGNSFYRLSQTDKDGTTKYFDIRAISLTPGADGLTVFPNPAPAGQSVTLGVNYATAGKISVHIINAQGLRVQTASYQKGQGYWRQPLPVATLAPGVYIVHVKGEGFERQYRLLKQ
jgi:hypothetical protein